MKHSPARLALLGILCAALCSCGCAARPSSAYDGALGTWTGGTNACIYSVSVEALDLRRGLVTCEALMTVRGERHVLLPLGEYAVEKAADGTLRWNPDDPIILAPAEEEGQYTLSWRGESLRLFKSELVFGDSPAAPALSGPAG